MTNSSYEIRLDERSVGKGHPCFIIAEIGVNHNGDINTALKMVDAVAKSGADCVKFQTFSADEFVNNPDETYEYISQGERVRESQLAMFKRLELKREEFSKLFARATEKGIMPLSTPTDRAAVDLLDDLGVGAFKIGSDDLVYTPFLEYVAAKGKPIIISTGMADVEDIDRAVNVIENTGNLQICLLHCVSLYPTPDADINLRKIPVMAQRYNYPVGFSDHSDGVTAALGAVALEACIIEKHFTLDRNMPGPDHRFSTDPKQLTELVLALRKLEESMGKPDLVPVEDEFEMRRIARRSIVAARDLPAGHIIAEKDLAFQRPGTGLMPYEIKHLLGCRAKAAIKAKSLLSFDQVTKPN